MNRFVALLRGISVGGKNLIQMSALHTTLDRASDTWRIASIR